MKATKKIFGAMALSAALAVGTAMPAFAAGEEATTGVDGSVSLSTDGAQSTIKAKALASNINATVPLTVTCIIKGTEKDVAHEIMAPEPTVYKVINNGENAIKLKKEVVATAEGNWKLPATAGASVTAGANDAGVLALELNGTEVTTATNGFALSAEDINIPSDGDYGLTLTGTANPKNNLSEGVNYTLVQFTFKLG